MSSRLGLYLERLTLDDLLFLESELERRKDKYRRQHVVLVLQTEQRLMTSVPRDALNVLAKEMRRFVNDGAVAGNGVVMAYTPESSVVLFRDVRSASLSAIRLLTTLADLNGRLKQIGQNVGVKLGLASGDDILAAGSMRSVRKSAVVKRATQCAWKAPTGSLLMDENCAFRWEPRNEAMKLPLEIDGLTLYRTNPALASNSSSGEDEEKLVAYLDALVSKGISTLKYFLLREESRDEQSGQLAQITARAVITLESFDPQTMRNVTFTTRCPLSEYTAKVDRVFRLVSERGLGLVKHEESMPVTSA